MSNLILTLIFTITSIISVPQFFEDTLENSNLVSFYTDTSGTPQQALELITGTDLIKVVSRIKDLTGKSSVVVGEQGCIEIPKYSLSNLSNNNEQKNELYELLLTERSNQNLAPLELSEKLSNIALNYAYVMYQEDSGVIKIQKMVNLLVIGCQNKDFRILILAKTLLFPPRSGLVTLVL